ncbi:STAS domain-containing protein [Nonomuraea sp. B12E4]|uniref:STAS domain-containing protein n=1 Tax=Nonomuraea sp. B12E4 TaxID=3153564 RepID=UPI00325F2D54
MASCPGPRRESRAVPAPHGRPAHQRLSGAMVISVSGELDATNRAQLETYLREVRPRHGARLVFDLSRVPFMDSSGLHVLLMCATDCLKNGGTVHLAAVQPLPARLFEITGILTHVPVHDTLEEAVTSAKERSI